MTQIKETRDNMRDKRAEEGKWRDERDGERLVERIEKI